MLSLATVLLAATEGLTAFATAAGATKGFAEAVSAPATHVQGVELTGLAICLVSLLQAQPCAKQALHAC